MKQHWHRCFYKKMKRLTYNRIVPISTILDERGKPLQKGEEKLERWKQHFEKVLNVQNEVEVNVLEDLEDHSETDMTQLTGEVEQAVKKLQNGRAAGEDEVVAEMLKNGGEVMIDWLLEILQEVWRTKQLPSEWKKSIRVSMHKKKDRKVCNNYRGISLLSIPGKVLSLVLLDRLETIIDPQLMEAQWTRHSRPNLGYTPDHREQPSTRVLFTLMLWTSPRPMTLWTAQPLSPS